MTLQPGAAGTRGEILAILAAYGERSPEQVPEDIDSMELAWLVHQLHLNEIAVALVVFDSRSETDPFSGVKHWVRALAQARRLEDTVTPLRTYLVAARADRGGVAVSKQRIQAMIDDLGLDGFFETSAKEGWQITDVKDAIGAAIGLLDDLVPGGHIVSWPAKRYGTAALPPRQS